MYAKSWWESKTLWFNGLVFLLGAIAYVLRGVQTGEVPLDIDGDTVAMLVGVVGMLLRWATKQPLK